jgi:hypothetical protein
VERSGTNGLTGLGIEPLVGRRKHEAGLFLFPVSFGQAKETGRQAIFKSPRKLLILPFLSENNKTFYRITNNFVTRHNGPYGEEIP